MLFFIIIHICGLWSSLLIGCFRKIKGEVLFYDAGQGIVKNDGLCQCQKNILSSPSSLPLQNHSKWYKGTRDTLIWVPRRAPKRKQRVLFGKKPRSREYGLQENYQLLLANFFITPHFQGTYIVVDKLLELYHLHSLHGVYVGIDI